MTIQTGDSSARKPVRFLARAVSTRLKRPMILSSAGLRTLPSRWNSYRNLSRPTTTSAATLSGRASTIWEKPAGRRKLRSSGALDTCGFPKDAYYFYQSRWTTEPVLHLFPHWNWAGREGKVITVTCYTNCDTVELFLNGKSLGVKGYAFPRPGMVGTYGNYPPRAKALQTTADLHLSWDVPFTAGNAYCQRSERWQGHSNGRDQNNGQPGEARSDGRPAAYLQRTQRRGPRDRPGFRSRGKGSSHRKRRNHVRPDGAGPHPRRGQWTTG